MRRPPLVPTWSSYARLQYRTARASLAILRRHLGTREALRTAASVLLRQLRGDPWRALSPPGDPKEADSRLQSGPAIVAYRYLCEKLGQPAALAITAELVAAGALVFLPFLVPTIALAESRLWTDDQRRELISQIVGRFPNASCDAVVADASGFSFHIRACAFVTHATALGHPELAATFCGADAAFFARQLPELIFTRPTTLAANGSSCHFCFRVVDAPPAAERAS
ncbi:MAG: L-2-amino-thiazoline-4-carboxylic acid hydrolase [Candidatus Schekmanbacteria bacterium]|nr:L-2-amino-thiazoline-4-carboxylic acid hydrolase [Candidatus Schekmanbacteria bacterium]